MRLLRPFIGTLVVPIVVLVLSGCGSGSAPAIPTANSAASLRYGSWIDPAAAHERLLYVSDPAAKMVHIYSYPYLKPVGDIAGLSGPEGLCVDPGTGSVWVTVPSLYKVIEFPHGSVSSIGTLKSYYYPVDACAVDQNGDVAAVAPLSGSDPGALLVFKNGRGKPTYYHSRDIILYGFVGYDQIGDAFVDGGGEDLFHFELAELAAGQSKLQNVTPHHLTIHNQGGVQYDGYDLAVGDEQRDLIYRVSSRQVVATIHLQGACLIRDFFIDVLGGRLIVPSGCGSYGEVLVYNYPAGGNPIRIVKGLSSAFGAVVSR
jgi:hypothetical protein